VTRDIDVVVVGAGVTGAATAYVLARRGMATLVVERFDVGHDRGSSHGTSRIFRLNYPDERYVRMAQSALAGWRELEDECGRALITTVGALDLGQPALDNARALAACGVRFDALRGDEISHRFGIDCDAAEPGVFQPDGGTIRADHALDALLAGATAAGAELQTGVEVRELALERGRVRLETDCGSITARAVVVTAGAWAPRLLTPIGFDLPVIPTRETLAYVTLARAASLPCVIDYERLPAAGTAGLPRAGQAGYALPAPEVGLKIGLHHAGPRTDPDERPAPDEAIAEWATRWAKSRYPDAGELITTDTCIYTNTADETFVLERHGRIVVGSACSGHGFKFAPVVGRTLAAFAVEAAR
jgi:sarcosine oxidase